MKNKLDELFKKKTEGYRKEPSAEAWSKIHKNLHPRTRIPVWQIAASILLIAGITAVIYLQINNEGNQSPAIAGSEKLDPATTETPDLPEENMVAQQTENTEERVIEPDTTHEQTVQPVLPAPVKKSETLIAANEEKAKEIVKEQEIVKPVQPEILDNKDALAIAKEIPVNPEAKDEVNQLNANSNPKRPVVTIVYQKSDSEHTAVAQHQEKENKEGLGKFFNLAKDLKNGDLNLSEIRDVKDELLALDITIRRNNAKTRD